MNFMFSWQEQSQGLGAFEQHFGPGEGEFEQKFSKNSNAQGVARGGRGC